jgi:hypothetical protein
MWYLLRRDVRLEVLYEEEDSGVGLDIGFNA